MRLHVITPISRPKNIPRVAASLYKALERAHLEEVVWHWTADPDRTDPAGFRQRNAMLAQIPTRDWVWCLDDDTLVHEELFLRLGEPDEDVDAVVFGQIRPNEQTFHADPFLVHPGRIDLAQVIFRAGVIDGGFPDEYIGDGLIYEQRLPRVKTVYVDEPLTLYNALRR